MILEDYLTKDKFKNNLDDYYINILIIKQNHISVRLFTDLFYRINKEDIDKILDTFGKENISRIEKIDSDYCICYNIILDIAPNVCQIYIVNYISKKCNIEIPKDFKSFEYSQYILNNINKLSEIDVYFMEHGLIKIFYNEVKSR